MFRHCYNKKQKRGIILFSKTIYIYILFLFCFSKEVLNNRQSLTFITFFFYRFLFWTEFGNGGKIGRAYMDGTLMSYISTSDLVWPNGLTIDYKCKDVIIPIILF